MRWTTGLLLVLFACACLVGACRRKTSSLSVYDTQLAAINCEAALQSELDSKELKEHNAALRWFGKNELRPGRPAEEVRAVLDKALKTLEQHANGSEAPTAITYVYPTTPRVFPLPPPSKGGYNWYGVWVDPGTRTIVKAHEIRAGW
jgi:hypothetical protein